MRTDLHVQDLIDQVRAAGWIVTPVSNGARFKMRGPQGQGPVFCPTMVSNRNLLKAIIRDLARHGLDLGCGIAPDTAVKAAWEEAIARRERKLTAKEAGEDREPAEVIIRHPKGSGSAPSTQPTSTTTTVTTTVTTGESVPTGSKAELFQFTSISDAQAAGFYVSDTITTKYENDLTCKRCGTTVATIGGCGPHNAKHDREDKKGDTHVMAALQVITDALTSPTVDNSKEVDDLKRRLKMVKKALDKPLMGMVSDITKALEGLDL